MKVLLIQPPIEDFYLTEIRTYPLNLIWLGSVLENAGIEVKILDCLNPLTRQTVSYPKELAYLKEYYNPSNKSANRVFGHFYRFGLKESIILEHIQKYKPDVIGLPANFTAYFNTTASLCQNIKQKFPNIKIVIGGYHATVFKEAILEQLSAVDHIIAGEGEQAMLDYLGINNKPFNFESFIPSHHFIQQDRYQMHRHNMASLIASRGCANTCTFCTVASMFGHSMRWREINSIIAEMNELYQQNKVRVFNFEDDNLSLNHKWFKALLDKIITKFQDIRLYAMNGLSMETLNKELLDLMWQAGFRNLNISLVTAQESEQKKLNRQSSNQIFDTLIKIAKQLGFEITVYFIMGLPGQTADNIEETLTFLNAYDVLITPSIFYPPPGTTMYQGEPWITCRSSAFAADSPTFPRAHQVQLFSRIRNTNQSKLLANNARAPD